jgi:TPR repeat protein
MRQPKFSRDCVLASLSLAVLLLDARAQTPVSPQAGDQAISTVVISAPRPGDLEGYRAVEARIKRILSRRLALSSPFLSWCMENRFAEENASAPGGRLPSVNNTVLDIRSRCARAHIQATDMSLRQGLEAFGRRDYTAARDFFQQAYAKMGTADAALMLAKMHLDGLGAPKDTVQGIKWLRDTAESRFDPQRDRMRFNPEDPQAMNARVESALMLARIYGQGDGAARDWKQAAHWYSKAAEFGFVPALDILGQAGLAGHDSERDVSRALDDFKTAADAGYSPAAYHLRSLNSLEGDGAQSVGATFQAAATTRNKDDQDSVNASPARDTLRAEASSDNPASNPQRIGAQNQADAAAVPVVRVTGLRAVPWKSYRAMRAALAAYEKYRYLAPDAMFSFAILPSVGKTLPPNFEFRVRTRDGAEFPIRLERGGLFQLPVVPDPDADANLVSNLKEGQLRIGLLLHTRNVPPAEERLGDVRLRNEISQAIGDVEHPNDDPGCWRRRNANECRRGHTTVWFKPRAPASGAWLVEGNRREALESNGDRDYPSYRIPINAGHLGNDVIITFDYKHPLGSVQQTVVMVYDESDR